MKKSTVGKIKLGLAYGFMMAVYCLILGICLATSINCFTTQKLAIAIAVGFFTAVLGWLGLYAAVEWISKHVFQKSLSTIIGFWGLEASGLED